MLAVHRQDEWAVRFEWGPTGAAAVSDGATYAVVVDVLSFTTTLSIAVGRGMTVFPYRWRDDGATAYARERAAVLAVGRFEAVADPSLLPRHADETAADGSGSPRNVERSGAFRGVALTSRPGAVVSLSPAAMARVTGVRRVVLPSPNGSAIAYALRESGATVVGACLRNAEAVAGWLAPRLAAGASLAVVAAGERWPDGTLRPAVEDLWGAGAVIAACAEAGVTGLSPEAATAADSFGAVRDRMPEVLAECASGRELIEAGFADDVAIAAECAVSSVVPVLTGDAFVPAG